MSANQSNARAQSHQEKLNEYCRTKGIAAPTFNIVSDRRGGRTAWSATVTINGNNVAARYWYDGQYINNAKEDAAEVAMMRLNHPRAANTTTQNFQAGGASGNGRWGAR